MDISVSVPDVWLLIRKRRPHRILFVEAVALWEKTLTGANFGGKAQAELTCSLAHVKQVVWMSR